MTTPAFHHDPEKGTLTVLPPMPPQPALTRVSEKASLSTPAPPHAVVLPNSDKPKPPKKKVSRWIRWQLWFNTYRKFFTFVLTFNVIGILLAITGHWPYARKYTGPIVLGNLLFAILMRNELFGRFLYLVINTLFAKVHCPLIPTLRASHFSSSASPFHPSLTLPLPYSGHRFGSDWAVHLSSSISGASTLVVPRPAFFGSYTRSREYLSISIY